MKRKYSIAAILCTLFIAFCFYALHVPFYQNKEHDTFTCKLGETFTVGLRENSSTGIVNCWINQSESYIVTLVDKKYKPGINARLGYEGSGGTVNFTFKAVSIGHDTIKMASCPLGPENTRCEDYTPHNTESNNEFIIHVVE